MLIIKKLYRFYVRSPKLIVVTSGLLVISTASLLLIPRLASNLVGLIDESENITTFATDNLNLITIVIFLLFLFFITNSSREYLFSAKSDEIMSNIRLELYSHGLKRDFENTGDISRKRYNNTFLHDINALQSFLSTSIPLAQSSLVRGIFSFFLLIYIDLNLTLIYTSLLLIAVAFIITFEIKLQHYTTIVRESYKNAYATAGSPIQFNSLVMKSGKNIAEEKVFKDKIDKFISHIRKKRLVNHMLDFAFKVTVIFLFVFFSLYAGKNSSLLIGDSESKSFLEYLGYLLIFSLSIASLLSCVSGFIRANASLRSVSHELEKDEIYTLKEKIALKDFSRLEIEDLFHSKKWTICKEEIVIIEGESGSGKSTLCKKVAGIADSDRFKCIMLDSKGRQYPNQLYSAELVAYLPAYPEIMNGTIIYNIGYSSSRQIDMQTVNRYLKILDLSERINDLPNGLETVVDGHDSILSTGELQRIAIIRALVSEPDIVILDEAVSVLDFSKAVKVIELFKKINSTILLVSHRPDLNYLGSKIIKVKNDGRE